MFEFQVDSISAAGHVIGRNGDRDIPVGKTFTEVRRTRVHKDDRGIWSEDAGFVAAVCLTLREVHWYGRSIEAIPGGHTAAVAVTGEGLELLARALGSLPEHEYLLLVAHKASDA